MQVMAISKADKYSRKAFYQRILDYCQTINVVCNPPHLYKKARVRASPLPILDL